MQLGAEYEPLSVDVNLSNVKTYLPLIGGFVLILAAGIRSSEKEKGYENPEEEKITTNNDPTAQRL